MLDEPTNHLDLNAVIWLDRCVNSVCDYGRGLMLGKVPMIQEVVWRGDGTGSGSGLEGEPCNPGSISGSGLKWLRRGGGS